MIIAGGIATLILLLFQIRAGNHCGNDSFGRWFVWEWYKWRGYEEWEWRSCSMVEVARWNLGPNAVDCRLKRP